MLGGLFVALLVAWLIVNLVKTPSDFFTVMLIGITTGSVYALIALGYTLVYGILQLINFAHGDVFALCGLFASTIVLSLLGLNENTSPIGIAGGLLLTLLIVVAFGLVVNTSIEFIAYRRLRNAPRLAVLITAVGMSFIIQNISLAVFDVNFRSLPPLISESNVFKIGTVTYQWNQLFAVLDDHPGSARSELARQVDEAGQRDARRFPGPRCCRDHGGRTSTARSRSRSRSQGALPEWPACST